MDHIQAPPVFLATPGTPPIPWLDWQRMFMNYLEAIGGANFPECRKKAVFLNALGVEGQRVYYNLPQPMPENAENPDPDEQAPTLAQVMQVVETHFAPKRNVVASRYKFRRRLQAPTESTDDWCAALRALVVDCQYGPLQNEMIRDTIVENTNSARIRERLLMESDLTLEKTLTIARQIENAVKEAKAMLSSKQSLPDSSIQAVSSKTRPTQKYRPNQTNRRPGKSSVPNPNVNKQYNCCFRCGNSGHIASDRSCPATGQSCRSCQKIGHYSKMCRSNRSKSQVHYVAEESDKNDNSDVEYQVLSVNQVESVRKNIECNVDLVHAEQRIEVPFLVDSGAEKSLIPITVYEAKLNMLPLKPSNVSLTTYDGTPIKVHGMIKVKAMFNNKQANASFCIVDGRTAVLGVDVLHALGLIIDGANFSVRQVKSPELLRQYPKLFSKSLGTMKGFIHKIQLKPSAQPVACKLRQVPLALRDKVAAELKQLEVDGVIEKIDAAEWAHPMVAVTKPNGKIRICCDLRELNKVVIADNYPLPNIRESLACLSGAKVFTKLDMSKAYFQMLLHKESRPLTAFLTPEGLFQYRRLPMGLKSSASAFQKAMEIILAGLPGVIVYQDDILVFGSNQMEHDERLHAVLHDCRLMYLHHHAMCIQTVTNYASSTILQQSLNTTLTS